MATDDEPMQHASPKHVPQLSGMHTSDGEPEPAEALAVAKSSDEQKHYSGTTVSTMKHATARNETGETTPNDKPVFKDKWSTAIDKMMEERRVLKLEQRMKTKAIRKTIRQKRRTMKNAKKLTDDELAQIVLDRRILEFVEKEAESAGVASSSSLSKSKTMESAQPAPTASGS